MQNVVVLSAVRSGIGRFGGGLKDIALEDLGAQVAKAAVERAGVDADKIESAIVGSVIRTKARDAYISRMVALGAGLPQESQSLTVNRLCGSGLEAIVLASQQIQLGETSLAMGGGCESMSRSVYSSSIPRFGAKMGDIAFEDDMTAALNDPFGAGHMGITAENLAEQYQITREEQDEFSAESHRRAIAAIKAGYFDEQKTPVTIKTRKGDIEFIDDEHPRDDVTTEGLAALRPAFKKDGGTVTAGNASGINDGASFLIVASEDWAEKNGKTPIARLVSYARAGVDPSIMGIGPVPASQIALKRADLSVDDLDVIESNEAFAAQACAVAKGLHLPADKTNPNGGAVALGHPIGASGGIIATKLIYELQRTGGKYGLATMCIGGGQGIAAIFERL